MTFSIHLALASLASVLDSQTAVVHRKLSGPMVEALVGDVTDPVISPSGDRVLYRVVRGAEVASIDGPAHLEVAPTDGSAAPLRLTRPRGLDVLYARWTPDATRAVFVVGQKDGDHAIYSVPADGSSAPTLLVRPAVGEDVEPFLGFREVLLTGDSLRVVFMIDTPGSAHQYEIYSVPVTGGQRMRLNGTLVSGGSVSSFDAAGATVVYVADQEVDGVTDLYAVPADGSAAPINLSEAGSAAERVVDFEVAPSATTVVYSAHAFPSAKLFAVPIDGSAPPVLLSTPGLPTGRGVTDYLVSPAGTSVVYRADETEDERFELFLAPIDGSAAPVRLVEVGASGAVEDEYAFSPDGAYVVYQADMGGGTFEERLFAVRVSDGTIAPLHTMMVTSFQITADSTRVVFLGPSSPPFLNELYSAPIDGSSATVRINPDFVDDGVVDAQALDPGYAVTADSLSVVYRADADTDGVAELYRVATVPAGPPVATKLNPALVPGGLVGAFRIVPDSSAALFLTDAASDDVTELLRSALAGPPAPTPISGAPLTGAIGDASIVVARNGRAVYAADQEVDGQFELFGVPSDGSAPAVKISGTLVAGGDVIAGFPEPTGLSLSPDGATAVYLANAVVVGRVELFSAPTDGSSAPVKLNGALTPGTHVQRFAISPDGTRVVYVADEAASPSFRVHSVPIGGGTGAVLSAAVPSATAFLVTAGSAHVVYGHVGVWSVPIDGSAAAIDVSQGIGGSQTRYAATADESRVVFVKGGRLYSNAMGGGAPVELSGTLVSGGGVGEIGISVDDARVVFRADAITDGRVLLFSVPIDGSGGRVMLNGPLVGGGDVHSFVVSPDGVNVVYQAEQVVSGSEHLHRVPVDGSAPDVLLSTSPVNGSYQITPDGAHIVTASGGLRTLPITGGDWAILATNVEEFAVTAGGQSVVYVTEPFGESDRLMLAPIEGGPPIALSPTSFGGLLFAVDGPRVVYRTAREEATLVEVFACWLQPVEHMPLDPGRPIRR